MNTTKGIIAKMNDTKDQLRYGLISQKEYDQIIRQLDMALMGCDN